LYEPLIHWTTKNHEATLAQDREAMAEVAREFEDFIDAQLETRRRAGAGPDADVTASLMHEKIEGRPLSREEITSILRNWTAGEVGTIAAAVGILAHFVAEHAELQGQLRAQPSLLPAAIDEILRIHGPLVANRRSTTRPVEIGGRKIDAGERLSLIWISANRDGRVFKDPDAFRLDRDPSKNLLYGAGIHVCPGAPLARMELRVVMEELLERTARIEAVPGKSPTNAVYPASGFSNLPLIVR
jgi:cytochrome P450